MSPIAAGGGWGGRGGKGGGGCCLPPDGPPLNDVEDNGQVSSQPLHPVAGPTAGDHTLQGTGSRRTSVTWKQERWPSFTAGCKDAGTGPAVRRWALTGNRGGLQWSVKSAWSAPALQCVDHVHVALTPHATCVCVWVCAIVCLIDVGLFCCCCFVWAFVFVLCVASAFFVLVFVYFV